MAGNSMWCHIACQFPVPTAVWQLCELLQPCYLLIYSLLLSNALGLNLTDSKAILGRIDSLWKIAKHKMLPIVADVPWSVWLSLGHSRHLNRSRCRLEYALGLAQVDFFDVFDICMLRVTRKVSVSLIWQPAIVNTVHCTWRINFSLFLVVTSSPLKLRW